MRTRFRAATVSHTKDLKAKDAHLVIAVSGSDRALRMVGQVALPPLTHARAGKAVPAC